MYRYLLLTMPLFISCSLYCMEQEPSAKAPDDSKILIFYKIDENQDNLQTIKDNQKISSYAQRYQESSHQADLRAPGRWDKEYIYFSLYLDKKDKPDNIIGYLIDPKITHVYNKKFRDENNEQDYWASGVRLHVYLERKQREEKMKWEAPQDQIVITDTRSAEPFYSALKLPHKERHIYIPEVRFYRDDIPFSKAIVLFDEGR